MDGELPEGWRSTTLGEFTTLQRGIDLPEPQRRRGFVPIIGSSGFTGWHNEARATGPGVAVGRSGASFGVVSYSPVDFWPLNTALYVSNFNGNDPRFAYYYLQTIPFTRYNSGSAQPSLNRNFVHPMEVRIPPLPEQRRIAHLLGALDDKIELLRKMNRTLEELAQALFKSWFITFDGHDDLVDSEIGPVPRGWPVRPIGEVVKVVGGSTPSTAVPAYWEPGVFAWATPKDLSGVAAPVLLGTDRKISPAGLQTIGSGLLPVGSFLLSSRAPIGYTTIAQVPVAINQGFIGIPPGGALPSSYLLFWTRFNMDSIKGRAGGTTFAEISKAAFRPIPVVVPPAERLRAFEAAANPLLKRIVSNVREMSNLAELRDTLLPKLISGELRVPWPEAEAPHATSVYIAAEVPLR